jgi:biopolymer transport protein ExbB/TolQ
MITQSLLSVSLIGTEWILYILILMSIVSWAIIIEKFLFLKKRKGRTEALEREAQGYLSRGDAAGFGELLKRDASTPAAVVGKLLEHVKSRSGRSTLAEEYLAVLLSQEKLRLESRLAFLGTLVSIAPFVGLLGTVLGIIHAFHGLAVNKQGGELVMAGIAEALIATALGLFIAIPAAAFYNYFLRNIKKIIVSSENLAQTLLLAYYK